MAHTSVQSEVESYLMRICPSKIPLSLWPLLDGVDPCDLNRMNRTAVTALVCPIRCARWITLLVMACHSTAGFQSVFCFMHSIECLEMTQSILNFTNMTEHSDHQGSRTKTCVTRCKFSPSSQCMNHSSERSCTGCPPARKLNKITETESFILQPMRAAVNASKIFLPEQHNS